MNTIINAVFSEIGNCAHTDPSNIPLRACIDSKVESLALTGMLLVEKNPGNIDQNKHSIRQLVKQAIEDCHSSLEEVGYDTTGWDKAQKCIIQRGDRLVDMAVDMMTEGILPGEKEIYEGTRKKRCSRRKSKSNSLKSILRKSNSRRKKSSKRVIWKR